VEEQTSDGTGNVERERSPDALRVVTALRPTVVARQVAPQQLCLNAELFQSCVQDVLGGLAFASTLPGNSPLGLHSFHVVIPAGAGRRNSNRSSLWRYSTARGGSSSKTVSFSVYKTPHTYVHHATE
jgi:hypothetical protein